MKIVCISASFIPSNTANSIQVVKATQALVELGHQVVLLVPGEGLVDSEEIQAHYGLQQDLDIRWIKENLAFRRYDFALKSFQIAKNLEPDLFYTWVLQAAVMAVWGGIPTILELHDRITGRFGPWLFRKFWKSKTPLRVLTNTNALREALIREFELVSPETKILVAPNGVDLACYRDMPNPTKARERLGLPSGFTAGYTGHFYSGRGMGLMFELAKALPEVNFLWVGGEAPDVTLWESRLRAEGVKNITLTGFVPNQDVPLYQAASDVLLMPYGRHIAGSGGGDSAEIASPMKMFEYMAAGRAIISSDLPVIHEVLDKNMAIFCNPEDLDAWQTALMSLKEDSQRREKLGKFSQDAVKSFTWYNRAQRAISGFVN